jgi:hypothetical protein
MNRKYLINIILLLGTILNFIDSASKHLILSKTYMRLNLKIKILRKKNNFIYNFIFI